MVDDTYCIEEANYVDEQKVDNSVEKNLHYETCLIFLLAAYEGEDVRICQHEIQVKKTHLRSSE